TGFLPAIYYAELILTPLLIFILHNMWTARSSEGFEKMHTYGFFYAISFLLFTLVVSSPSLKSLGVVVSAFICTLLVASIHIDSRIESRDWEHNSTPQKGSP